MPNILHIETSTVVCSVAISSGNKIIYSKKSREEKSHASSLAVFIDEGMKLLNMKYTGLDALAVSKGPGSYTGLRIGVSTAKGICYGAGLPLIAVCTLQTMASGIIDKLKNNQNIKNSWFCPMIDARRMEVYTAFYDYRNNQKTDISADIISEGSFRKILDKRPVYFFGDGSEKCRDVLKHKNAVFIENIYPDAINMVPLAIKLFESKKFENTAYFEPFYLKDFIATIPKKDIYG